MPLVAPPGALVLDSTGRSVESVVRRCFPSYEPTRPATGPPSRTDLIIYHICRFIAVGVSRVYFRKVMGRENYRPAAPSSWRGAAPMSTG